jgi:hypothetical protein
VTATNIEEAVAILCDLRERAAGHYHAVNDWLLVDTIDEVVALLEGRPES